MTIVPFLRDGVFDPRDIRAMSKALEDVCAILNLADDEGEKERLARKIIALAHGRDPNAELLRDLTLREVASGQGGWAGKMVRAARQGALCTAKNGAGSS